MRQECVYLAGSFSLSEADDEKTSLLNTLNDERNILQRQIVSRSDPQRFKWLRKDCHDFMESVKHVLKDLEDLKQGAEKILHWQVLNEQTMGQII